MVKAGAERHVCAVTKAETSDKVTLRSDTNTLGSDKLPQFHCPRAECRVLLARQAASDNFMNGSDNVRDRPIY